MRLVDSFGRRIDYLRLSVTDRCNLRCLYCLPEGAAGGLGASRTGETLEDEEILRLVSVAAELGISKVRVTGGEPLLRPRIAGLVKRLAVLPGIEEVSLSTNGLLLSRLAMELRAAGLRRINVSLDTLDPGRFREITRFGRLDDVLEGVQRALDAGFSPLKINVVVMRGINDGEIPDFAGLVRRMPLHVRFIELMPIGLTGFFSKERWLPLGEIKARCGEIEPLGPEDSPEGSGPAVYFRPRGALGTVGFIGALSCNFCGRCNRLRLTARGRLMPCLASDAGLDLKEPLRSGADDGDIAGLIRRVVAGKPERHSMEPDGSQVRESFMCSLGG